MTDALARSGQASQLSSRQDGDGPPQDSAGQEQREDGASRRVAHHEVGHMSCYGEERRAVRKRETGSGSESL